MTPLNPYNALLYWLSHKGIGTAEQFRHVCQRLGLAAPHRVRRHLQLLGHIEMQQGGHKWSVSPASWVQAAAQAGESERWFLCGQRSAAWQAAEGLMCEPQEQGPDLWWASAPIALPEPQVPVVVAGPTAEKLRPMLIPVAQWVEDLVPIRLLHGVSSYDSIEKWDPDHLRFVPWKKHSFERGVFQFKRDMGRYESSLRLYYLPPRKGQKQTSQQHWLVADFTGLRFVSAFHGGFSLIVHYNSNTGELWIPEDQRWPYIYERCLILNSGQLPRKVTRDLGTDQPARWLYYSRISESTLVYFIDQLMDGRIEATEETLYV